MKIKGKNVIYEAIKQKAPIVELFIEGKENDSLVEFASKNGLRAKFVNKQTMDKDFGVGHQGVGAYVTDYEYYDLSIVDSFENPNIFILDGIEDPHNLGAIIRTANSSGVDAVIIPKDRSASVNSTVVTTSTGAVYSTKIIQVNNINRAIDYLKDLNVTVIGTDASGDKVYTDVDMRVPVAVVIGSEGKGMRKLVKSNCDILTNIPMKGSVTSLNASVSAALFMYEILRQRGI